MCWLIDWVRLNVTPTQYRSYGDGFLRVKWPNQQSQSTEGTLNQIKQNTTIHLNWGIQITQVKHTKKHKLTQVRSPPTTSGLETEWDYSSRKRREGQKKIIGKANERKRKVKRGKDGQGGRGVPRPHTGLLLVINSNLYQILHPFWVEWKERGRRKGREKNTTKINFLAK